MERASTEKPRIVETADRVAAHFVAALLIIAALTAGAWYVLDPARALWVSVSVLVVSCPCALSLATPVALTVATGAMSLHGLLVTRGRAIETLARATHFVFDKTGTLTFGRLRLAEVVPLGSLDDRHALRFALALERGSEHAVSVGFRHAVAQTVPLVVATDVRSVTGSGVEGRIEGRLYRVGRVQFVSEIAGDIPPGRMTGSALDHGSWIGLGEEGGWISLFRFEDTIRPEAGALVGLLRKMGCGVSILSGDTPGEVRRVADYLGVVDAHGARSPQQKHEFVVRLQRAGAVVAATGDGVNDAPVLAQAQVSIAMGGGTDLARTQGDLVLLSENLRHLGMGLAIARQALSLIRQNLIWAFAYNIIAIPAAMLGWVTPWMAGIGMSASSLLVVLNALRLQRTEPVFQQMQHATREAA
jgi:Cu2+-exporting ATPase